MKLVTYVSVLLLVISCSPHIQYLGEKYSPTSQVDFYYAERDIEKENKVMGIILNEADEYNDLEEVQTAMLEKAKSVGADAILFEAVDNERIGDGDQYIWSSKRKHSFFSIFNSNDKKGVVIRAKLLKYK